MKRNTKRFVKASRTARKVGRMSALKASKSIRTRKRRIMASMSEDQLRDELMSLIDDMDDRDVIYIWNEYCRNINDDISEIYDMDEFDEIADGQSPSDIARSIFYGDFRPNDKFFGFNGYGNYVSFNYLTDDNARYYPEDMVDYIIRNDDNLGDNDIREILDSANEEDDEDEE